MSCYMKAGSIKFLEDMMQGNMDRIYQPFLEKMPDRGIILDAGCGSGRDSLFFKNMGHMVIPMETSEEICQIAGERIGQAVLYCRYEDAHFKIPFDGIWACGSLVHLKHNELQRVLRSLKCYLKEKGTMYTSFMYGSYEGERGGDYYLDLDEKRAEDIFTSAGFNIEKMWVTESKGHENDQIQWLNILAGKNA